MRAPSAIPAEELMFIHGSRRLIGTVLGLIAAVAAVWSAFITWYGSREGSNIRIQDLFTTNGITLDSASTMNSIFLPLAFAALLCVIYAAVGWRSPLVLGGLVSIATALLWATSQAQTVAGLHADLVGPGPMLAAGAGALMLIAAAVAPPPRRRHRPAAAAPVPQQSAEPDGRTTGQSAYAAGYRDARSEIGHGATNDEQWAGRRSAPTQQQPSEPPTRYEDPNP
jgi:hypothetical protein